MARNKYPQRTVEKILEVSLALFNEKGYEKTTIQDIVNALGMSKGAIYHHFKSKEEILDAMIDRMTEQILEKAKSIVKQTEIPVLQRFTMMMLALNISDGSFGHEILEQVHKPQNALMHQKIQEKLLFEVTPLIATLITEGISQGICQTDYPEEVAEMTFLYSYTAFDDLMEYSEEEKKKKMTAFIYNLERLLNMEQGSMEEIIRPLFGQK